MHIAEDGQAVIWFPPPNNSILIAPALRKILGIEDLGNNLTQLSKCSVQFPLNLTMGCWS